MKAAKFLAMMAFGATITIGGHGAEINETQELHVTVKDENKVLNVEGSRDFTPDKPLVHRVTLTAEDGKLSKCWDPQCNPAASWTQINGGEGLESVHWGEQLPKKPTPGNYPTIFKNETTMTGQGNGEPRKYKWSAKEEHNICEAEVAIEKTANFIYAKATGAVPVTFCVTGLGNVRIDKVDLEFTLGNGVPITVKNAPFARDDGFGLKGNGDTSRYTAWARIQNFRNVKHDKNTHKIFGNQVVVRLHDVEVSLVPSGLGKGSADSAATSPSSSNGSKPVKFEELVSKPKAIEVYADEQIPVVEFGTVGTIPLNIKSPGVHHVNHLANNQSWLSQTPYLVDCGKEFPHVCGGTCKGPKFSGKGDGGFNTCTDEVVWTDTQIGGKTGLAEKHSIWLFGCDGQTIAVQHFGMTIGVFFDFSYATQEVQVLNEQDEQGQTSKKKTDKQIETGMVIAEKSKGVKVTMFDDGQRFLQVSGCEMGKQLKELDFIDFAFDLTSLILSSDVSGLVSFTQAVYNKCVECYEDHGGDFTTKAAYAQVCGYWHIYSHKSNETTKPDRRFGGDFLFSDDFQQPYNSLTDNSVAANVGDTHNGYVTVKVESRATTNLYTNQEISATALYNANFTAPVIVDAQ